MSLIRVLLVDDNHEFLEATARFLSTDPSIEIVGHALSGKDVLTQVPSLKPDLVLMDLAMPDMNGLEATRQVKTYPQAPRVIILTFHDNDEYRSAASAVQVDGFIAKSDLGVELLPMIHSLFMEGARQ
ncbi:MAG: response regulator transcription factor [Chloroflexi bacterium]|nr:response regulator transcription factor [Chloroflexota bacterium]